LVIHGCAIPRPAVTVALQRVFGLSPVEASLLLGLLKHDYVNKSAIREMAIRKARKLGYILVEVPLFLVLLQREHLNNYKGNASSPR
jgi:hypothetical protein